MMSRYVRTKLGWQVRVYKGENYGLKDSIWKIKYRSTNLNNLEDAFPERHVDLIGVSANGTVEVHVVPDMDSRKYWLVDC